MAAPSAVFAQDPSSPGGECTISEDCVVGHCYVALKALGVCYCEDPDRPVIGCACSTGTEDPCYGTTAVCCANEVAACAGADGTCVSDSVGCEPSDDTCISGTEDACAAYNEAYGVEYICCTYGGDQEALGSVSTSLLAWSSRPTLAPVSQPSPATGLLRPPPSAPPLRSSPIKSRENKVENEA